MSPSNFGREIERGLTGRFSPPVPITLPERLQLVRDYYGSGRKAAAALGVGESTWRRWMIAAGLSQTTYGRAARGSSPKGANAARLEQAAGEAARARSIVHKPTDRIRLDAKHTGGKDRNRVRKGVGDSFNLSPGVGNRVEQAYIKGGPDAAARALIDSIRDDFWHDALEWDGPEPPDDDYGLTVTAVYF